jgi:hypothetical protein
MPLRNLLKKSHDHQPEPQRGLSADAPQFTFLRTTTNIQEEIAPPAFPGDNQQTSTDPKGRSRSRSLFRKNSSPGPSAESRSLGERLHLRGSRSASSSSVYLPQNLPDAPSSTTAEQGDEGQAQWEMRATLLAKGNSISRSASPMEKAQSYHGVSDRPSDVGSRY